MDFIRAGGSSRLTRKKFAAACYIVFGDTMGFIAAGQGIQIRASPKNMGVILLSDKTIWFYQIDIA